MKEVENEGYTYLDIEFRRIQAELDKIKENEMKEQK